MIGAGGAARAVAASLLDRRATVRILNRSYDRARALARMLDPSGERITVAGTAADVANRAFDLVVNASAIGMTPTDPPPIDLNRLRHAGAVVDLVYRPEGTRWVEDARAMGIPAIDGLPMLLGQGAAAYERWWNHPAPTEVMRNALPM
jgi:shikimate dehydrogenase